MSDIPQTPAMPDLTVRPYKPDGGITQSGLISMLAAMIVTGGVLGFAAHHVNKYFWLIFLFPAGIGFVLGFVGNWCIGKGRIRNQFVGGAMGFLGGVAAMVLMHHFDYDAFKSELIVYADDVAAIREMTPAEKEEMIRDSKAPLEVRAFVEAAAVENFIDYLNWEAAQGITISKTGTSSGAPITGIGVWIYWVIELLIVAVVAFLMTRVRAAEPYSRVSADWKKPVYLGSFDAGMATSVVHSLGAGNVEQIKTYAATDAAGPVMVNAYVAPDHEDVDEVDVKVEGYSGDGKTRKTIGAFTYPAGSLATLKEVFSSPANVSDSVSSENPA